MTTILTAQELIEREFSYKNTDKALIKEDSIFAVQFNHLRAVLGEDMYNDIISSVEDNSLTDDEQTLIDEYVKPYLLPITYAEVLPDVVYHTSSQGIMINTPEFSANAERKGLQAVREHAYTRAETMKRRLIEYLCDNSTTFTLYCDETTTIKKHGGIITY